jgi:hypothetical protein
MQGKTLFRFYFTGTGLLPTRRFIHADSVADAFLQKDAVLLCNHDKMYVAGSMEEFRQTAWHRVPDPAGDLRDAFSSAEETIANRIGLTPSKDHPYNDHMR